MNTSKNSHSPGATGVAASFRVALSPLAIFMWLMVVLFALSPQRSVHALAGGPDAFGYRYIDSNELGGPTLNFEEIGGSGTTLPLPDDLVSDALPLGFNFDFYGVTYNQVYASSNGFLTFLPSQFHGCCEGQNLPDPTSPNGVVAGIWEDLDPSAGGLISYQTLGTAPNRRFILEYQNVPYFGRQFGVTFEIKLFESSNTIEVHYQFSQGDNDSRLSTAGIENQNGTDGLLYMYSDAPPNSVAVRYILGTPPAITSANNATFAVGTPGSFTVTATGTPPPTLSVSGALPSGITFNSNTGVLSGTPAAGTTGTYSLVFTAINGVPPSARQNFTLIVTETPSLVVDTTSDIVNNLDGKTSLREAIDFANSDPDVSEITFSPLFDSPQTIAVGSELPAIRRSLTITGPGAKLLTVRTTSSSDIFVVINNRFVDVVTTLSGLTIADASRGGAGLGAGLIANGVTTVTNCSFNNNSTGIFAFSGTATVTVTNCTFSGGDSGIQNFSTALAVTNCTFNGNRGFGVSNGGTTTVTNCTVSGNNTGIRNIDDPNFNAVTLVRNSIVAGNITNTSGTITDNGNNVVAATAAEAGLDPNGLQDNGGPTRTIALVKGSPALDKGANAPATDQRGLPRPFDDPAIAPAPGGDNSDIGAFEAQASLNIAPTVSDFSVQTLEDTARAFSAAEFDAAFSDANSIDSLQSIRIVTLPDNGTLTLNGAAVSANQEIARADIAALVYKPSADFNGQDAFDYNASDGSAFAAVAATITLQVLAVNDAPSFTVGANQTVNEDSGRQVLAGFVTNISPGPSDESAQKVAFTVTNDNSALFATQPTLAPNGTLTYTPAANANGVASVRVILQDDGGVANGGSNTSQPQTFTITISAVNDAPVAAAQRVAVDEDSSVDIILTASDIDSDNLTFSVVSGPPNGTLTGNAPNLTYTPNANFNGADSFTFKVNDGTADSNTATVSIVVRSINDAPVVAGQSVVTNEDTARAIVLSASDIDGDNLTFILARPPQNGTISGRGPQVTYTPRANFNGQDSFTFKVNDGKADSNTATVTLQVLAVNDAPSFAVGANQTVAEDSGPQVLAGFITNISSGPADESAQKLAFIVTNDNSALFTSQPTIAPNGTLTYTPTDNLSGVANVRVILQDDGGVANGGSNTSGAQTFTITISAVNDLPFVDLNGAASGTDFSATFSEDGGAVAIVDSAALTLGDTDNPNLVSATVKLTNAFDGALETLSATPAGSISSANLRFTDGTLIIQANAPLADYQAVLRSVTYNNLSQNPNTTPRRISFVVNDGVDNSNVAFSTVQVLAINDAPVAQSDKIRFVLQNSNSAALTITLKASDVDDQTLTYFVGEDLPGDNSEAGKGLLPRYGTLSGTAPNLIYTPLAGYRGRDAFTFYVSDGKTTSPQARIDILVSGSRGVVAANDSYTLTLNGESRNGQTPPQAAGITFLNGTFRIAAPGVIANDRDPARGNLIVRLAQTTRNGRLALRADGGFDYTPNAGFVGTDFFAYNVGTSISQAQGRVRLIVRDRRAPELSFDAPADDIVTAQVTEIRGRVSDDNAGLQSISLLWRRFDGKFWNGSRWVAAPTPLPLAVQGNNWRYTGALPQPGDDPATDLVDGAYDLRVSAVDKIGNTSRVTNSITIDRDAPDAPATSPVRLSGGVAATTAGTITLNFTGALNAASAVDTERYQVVVNGVATLVPQASYANNTVTLSGLRFGAGQVIEVQISGLRDALGRRLATSTVRLPS